MTEITMKKLAEIMKDEAANEKLENANGIEEVAAILNEYGVEVTAAELQEIVTKASGEELTEENLDMVAGGGWLSKAWGHVKSALNGFLDGFLGGYTN